MFKLGRVSRLRFFSCEIFVLLAQNAFCASASSLPILDDGRDCRLSLRVISSSVLLRLLCHRKSQIDMSVFNGSYNFSATNACNDYANVVNAKPEEAALDW